MWLGAMERRQEWSTRTLTGVPGQPRSNADLQHFVTGLEDGQVTEALVELHLPRAPCAPGTPILLLQLELKPVTSRLVGVKWTHSGMRLGVPRGSSEKQMTEKPRWLGLRGVG